MPSRWVFSSPNFSASGLTKPTFTGFYQVNAVIPAGVTGPNVSIAVAVGGVAGPAVTVGVE